MNRLRPLAALITLALIASACGSSGPNLRDAIGKVDAVTVDGPLDSDGVSALGLTGGDGDGVWSAQGDPKTVADAIAAVEAPDERSDDADGDVFLLYRSGTIWVNDAEPEGESAIVLYDDNDNAYRRHNTILIANSRWGSRVNDYRTSRSSGGNGFFRGGSSSGGK